MPSALSPSDLDAYFARIGYTGTPRADLETLTALHRAHLLAIPYENLDVQLGRPTSTDPHAAFDKLVHRRRGGWCYEMNGTFGLVLDALGFKVTRMAGAVRRDEDGASPLGNHLVLRVDLDEPWIADIGFGDATLDPYPLREGIHRSQGFAFGLERRPDGWLRFHNHDVGGAPYYDFREEGVDVATLEPTRHWLATSPDSPFMRFPILFRHTEQGVIAMVCRTFRIARPGEKEERVIESADEWMALLGDRFGLDVPEAAGLWPRICKAHEAMLAQQAAG